MPGIGELVIILAILLLLGLPLLIVLLVVKKQRLGVPPPGGGPLQQYERAVQDLGSDVEQVRTGAVHFIERVAYDYPPVRPGAWEVLQRFLEQQRAVAPDAPPQDRPDLQAAEQALGRMRDWADPGARAR